VFEEQREGLVTLELVAGFHPEDEVLRHELESLSVRLVRGKPARLEVVETAVILEEEAVRLPFDSSPVECQSKKALDGGNPHGFLIAHFPIGKGV
jgi:hypothetical protein